MRNKLQLREVRKKRVRAKIYGTEMSPRLTIYRSNKHVFAQIINDDLGKVICAASDVKVDAKAKAKKDKSFELGKLIAVEAKKKGVSKVVFDRNGYMYHGRVQAIADGAREGGLIF